MGTELEKVKAEKVTLMIHGKEREIKFGFSAWAKLEEEWGGLKNLEKKMQEQIQDKPFKTIPHLLYIGLLDKSAYKDEEGNEYPAVTEENILDEYGMGDMEMISNVFNRALYGSLPQEKKAEKEAKK